MNPGDRPRKTLLTVLGAGAAAAAVAGLAVAIDTTPAAAGELERFASCEALEAWTAQPDVASDLPTEASEDESPALPDDADSAPSSAASGGTGGGDASAAERSAAAPSSLAATADYGTGADGTNLIVEGVDELDVVDRLDERHVLVSAASRLSIIDLEDDVVVANLPVGYSVETTYDAGTGIAWVVGPDDETGRLTVTRVGVTPTSLAEQATWSTDGWLVDARRVGDRLHVVAADGYGDGAIPFASQPVPCDEVLHPTGESDASATLLVTLPATGPLEPEHATEVVGSGQLVHVTTDAAFLATPLYSGTATRTGIHRFDLDDLTLTGSGVVDGVLLNDFSMSEHEDHLRVALTDGGARFGRGIEGDDVAVDPAIAPSPEDALNEVVVLDTDGALDVVGRTPRFGHPGETLQGIRFDGAVAYAVTFLQTDPFYVLDLDDPADPKVAGEVELPGFSSYLHPVGEGLVAGFGPGDDGRIAGKLFDVTDRSQPAVVDTISLGDESAVAFDHHAFVDLGDGRFAVPAATYRELTPPGCTAERRAQLQAEEQRLNLEMQAVWATGRAPTAAEQAHLDDLSSQQARIYEEGCLYPQSMPVSSVALLEVQDGRLRLVERVGSVLSDTSASRVVPTDDGWALLAGNHWFVVDDAGAQTADLELGPSQPAYPVEGGPGGIVID